RSMRRGGGSALRARIPHAVSWRRRAAPYETRGAMIDFHNHLVPGVDDGAADLDASRAALQAYAAQGVTAGVTTPPARAAHTRPAARRDDVLAPIDAGWERLSALAREEFPQLRLERAAEVMLDVPAPDLGDPRVRLAGTRFALVEFPFMAVPP